MEEFWKNCKIFKKLRKFYAFISGKSGTEFWCYKEFFKKLEIDK